MYRSARCLGLRLLRNVCATGGRSKERFIHRGFWYKDYLQDLWSRRQLLGPDEPVPRSSNPNWNTETELFAFGKRLGEDFKQSTLRKIFTCSGAVQQSDTSEEFENGSLILVDYVKAYLRYHFPSLPEEGITAIFEYLTSVEMLSYIGRHTGITDLLEMTEFPASDEGIARSFKSVIGGLAFDSGTERAEHLIQDIVLTQLIGVDINDLWVLTNPMGVLSVILIGMKRGTPEPRLLRSAGAETITPVYVVGIYSDKKLLGQSPGETVQIAEEMAARDSLRNIWGTNEDRPPLSFGTSGRNLDLTEYRERTNGSLALLCQSNLHLTETKTSEQEEPLHYEEMMMKFKEKIEPEFGVPQRRRLKHKFFGGTYAKRSLRRIIKPRPTNV